jgi:hypothetical protein
VVASLIILAAIGISGSCFIVGTLLREDAAVPGTLKHRETADDFVHDFADDPRPASLLVNPPFHREGL